jgi:hypothetical protein
MAQTSGPRTNGTPVQRQFTDVLWGDLFGDGPGIVQDFDGSAYKLSLSSTSDTATVGSDTEDSISRVGGFNHTIPKSQPETLTIPPATGATQTAILGVKYDPASTGSPCSLVMYPSPGTPDGVPLRNSQPDGVVVLPLWSVTRQPAQVLSAATVTDLRRWTSSTVYPTTLPSEAPLGTVALLSTQRTRVRQMGSAGPAWVDPTPTAVKGFAIATQDRNQVVQSDGTWEQGVPTPPLSGSLAIVSLDVQLQATGTTGQANVAAFLNYNGTQVSIVHAWRATPPARTTVTMTARFAPTPGGNLALATQNISMFDGNAMAPTSIIRIGGSIIVIP